MRVRELATLRPLLFPAIFVVTTFIEPLQCCGFALHSAWLGNSDYKDWVTPNVSNPRGMKCKPCGECFDIAAMCR